MSALLMHWNRTSRHRNTLRGFGFLLQLVLLLATAITHQETTMNGAVAAMRMQQAAAAAGSRPPSCEGRCRSSCGHCQAVQVPVMPADLLKTTKTTTTSSSRRGGSGARSRRAAVIAQQAAANYDDHSNYKPLSWRCKCRIINS